MDCSVWFSVIFDVLYNDTSASLPYCHPLSGADWYILQGDLVGGRGSHSRGCQNKMEKPTPPICGKWNFWLRSESWRSGSRQFSWSKVHRVGIPSWDNTRRGYAFRTQGGGHTSTSQLQVSQPKPASPRTQTMDGLTHMPSPGLPMTIKVNVDLTLIK